MLYIKLGDHVEIEMNDAQDNGIFERMDRFVQQSCALVST